MFSLFLPEQCLHCEHPTVRARNRGAKDRLSRYLCEVCIRILDYQEAPGEASIRNQFYLVASQLEVAHCRSAYSFAANSPVQSVVHAFKYDGMPRLAAQFGRSIAGLAPRETQIIVPVPLHRTRMAERGYNQAEMMASGIAERRDAAIIRALKRTRPTPSQTQLSIPERIENVRGAFALSRHAREIEGKHALIVDDVMTTGSTLASVAETLLEARPKSISILTLAVAEWS
ncbi:MAG TPA: phosphoribosyltransferase family protein [Candidatus Kapabacteria bacterium]|nr:phosphoribosyltransferase family protein [Candidatus Kapabacteria bacterium]